MKINGRSLNTSRGASSINFTTADSQKMTILPNGNVGIGTIEPNSKLDVNGSTIITGSLTVTDGIIGGITGNASTATTLAAGKTIGMTGDVTWTSAAFNGSTNVTGTSTLANSGVTVGTYTKVTVDAKGRTTAGTVLSATDIPNLDAAKITTGTIDAARLPSYVDDVLEYTNLAGFPGTGVTGKIYVALDTNKIYRWSGSAYIEISAGAGTAWGGISGTLSNQTDLQNALNLKANLASPTFTGAVTSPSFVGALTGNASTATNVAYSGLTGTVPTWNQNTTGNAATATTAATLTTARTLTIGSTGKTFNGSANVAWTLAEIGAQAAGSYLTSFTETNTFLASGGSVSTHPGTNRLIFTGQVSTDTGLLGMPGVDNSNAFLNINRHSGEYNSQLGFSSNGNMYYRSFSATAINNTQTWRQVWDSQAFANNSTNWNTAFGWGNHATAGYLTSYTDTNTTYTAGTSLTLTGTTFSVTANGIGATQLNVTGNGTTSQYLRSDGDGTFTWATPTDTNTVYTHPAYTARNIDTSGAQVIDIITSDAIGSVTNITTRTLTLADIGAQAALTNPVTGTGVDNRVAVWSGTTTQDSSANLTFDGTTLTASNITNSGTYIANTTSTRDKIRVWSSSAYAIGMQTGYTFGGLVSDYAMTFQMNNSDTRGFWWGDESHTTANGAMALTTSGRLTVARALRVGYGEGDTTIPADGVTINGDTNITGTLTARVKSFIIDHPTKPTKKLQYGVLEGPEHSVYVRGRLTNENTIVLPDHWHALVHEDTITVNLTPIGKKQDLWIEELDAYKIKIGSEIKVNCFYTVFAERKDIEKLITEFNK